MVLFFWSVSLFSAQVLLAPTLANVFASRSLLLILSPVYLSFAAVAFFKQFKPLKDFSRFHFVSILGFLTLIGSMALVKVSLESIYNGPLLSSGAKISEGTSFWIVPLMFIVAIPYFFYYWTLLKLADDRQYISPSIVFVYELSGAATGTILGALILDQFSWVATFQLVIVSGWLAVIWIKESQVISIKNFIVNSMFLLTISLSNWFEPVSNLEWTARFARTSSHQSVQELERSWNTFSKIQVIQLENRPNVNSKKFIVIGDGAGTAQLSNSNQLFPISVTLSTPVAGEDILVLFAGPGLELTSFAKLGLGKSSLVGVEINQKLIDLSKRYIDLAKFPNISLIQKDARNFIETFDSKFDLILFSWSGATSAYYNGAAIHTAKYSLTKEAMLKVFSRLKENGVVLILGASKVSMVGTLVNAGIFDHPKDHIVLAEKLTATSFNGGWDEHALYVKKSKWSQAESDRLNSHLNKNGYQIVLSPFKMDERYFNFGPLLDPKTVNFGLDSNSKTLGYNYSLITDNKPFPFDVKLANETFLYLAICILGSLALWIGYSLYRSKNRLMTSLKYKYSAILAFTCGISGASMQVYLIYKFLLFTGQPTLALILGIGLSLMASAGIFWINSKYKFSLSQLIKISLINLIVVLIFGFIFEFNSESLFSLSSVFQFIFLAVFSIASLGIGTLVFSNLIDGQPDRSNLIGLDAVGGFLTVLLIPLLIEYLGINIAFVISFFCLATIVTILFLKKNHEKIQ